MPLLDHIEIISKRTAGKTSWKPCETVFIAIKLLFDVYPICVKLSCTCSSFGIFRLQATGSHAGPFYENIIGVFQRLGSCVDMCNRVCWDFVNQTETITSGLRKRLADVLGQVLVIIGMLTVTKQKQKATFVQSFISHFSKRRVDLNPVSDALERLVYLTKFDNLVIRRDTKI
ncbi:hypothetical protein DENSPDRAFT_839799 [Dentipellis sp. KUC8613]|nr:hypothetical protein DENSPDRAFT_839799 [Dentipellis sp. KUC8613]